MLPLRQIWPVFRLSVMLPMASKNESRSRAGGASAEVRRRARRASCLLVLLSATLVWAHRTLLNTPTFVGTVGPVFQTPGVDSAVATRATDQLFTELNVQARLRAALPPKAKVAAVPVTNATKGFVAGELTKVLASPQFQAVWTGALTSTHEQLVAVLRGQNTPAVPPLAATSSSTPSPPSTRPWGRYRAWPPA